MAINLKGDGIGYNAPKATKPGTKSSKSSLSIFTNNVLDKLTLPITGIWNLIVLNKFPPYIPAPMPTIPPAPPLVKTTVAVKTNTNNFVENNIQDDQYEFINGILKDKPEIIMSTNFLPLYKDNGEKTEVSQLIDTYSQMRYLRYIDIVDIVKRLSIYDKPVVTNDGGILYYNKISYRANVATEVIGSNVRKWNADVSNVLQNIRKLEDIKSKFNLTHKIHDLSVNDISSYQYQEYPDYSGYYSYESWNGTSWEKKISPQAIDKFWSKLGILQIKQLYVLLGYNSKNIDNFYNTKLWLQLLIDAKKIFKYHSKNLLNISTEKESSNSNSFELSAREENKNEYFIFDNSKLDTVYTLSELNKITTATLDEVVLNLSNLQKILYSNIPSLDKRSKILGLTNLLSKELLYSISLKEQSLKDNLSYNYDYSVNFGDSSGNFSLFDSVLGVFGKNIYQFPKNENNSLSSLAHTIENGDKVLNLEQVDISNQSYRITPGAIHYIDNMTNVIKNNNKYEYNLASGHNLLKKVTSSKDNFKLFIKNINLMRNVDYNQSIWDIKDKTKISYISADDFYNSIYGPINYQYTHGSTNDSSSIIALLTSALDDPNLMSLLFLYFRYLTTSNQTFYKDDSDLKSRIVDKIIEKTFSKFGLINLNSKPTRIYRQITPSGIKVEDIRSTLKSSLNNRFIKTISDAINATYELYKNHAIVNDKSVYSGYFDTVVYYCILELVCNVCSNHFPTVFVNRYTKNNVEYVDISVSQKPENEFNIITNKLIEETVLTRKLVSFILNYLTKLESSIKDFTGNPPNTVTVVGLATSATQTSQPSKQEINNASLNELLSNLDIKENPKDKLTEQQLLLCLSEINTINNIINVPHPGTDSLGPFSVSSLNDITVNTTTPVIINDSLILPNIKESVFKTLNQSAYKSSEGHNKKIMSIGVPNGFGKRLKQSYVANAKNKLEVYNKQTDIVKIKIYKTDLINPEIIFKPKVFLFELSRFPSQNNIDYKKYLSNVRYSKENTIPTIDYSDQNQQNNIPKIYNEATIKDSGWLTKKQDKVFSSAEYSFLSEKEKEEIINNHIMSYMLNVYIRLLTGVSLNERNFSIASSNNFSSKLNEDFRQYMIKTYISYINSYNEESKVNVDKTVSLFKQLTNNSSYDSKQYSNAQIGNIVDNNKDQNLLNVNEKIIPALLHGIKTINQLSMMETSISDVDSLKKSIFSTKKFDRIFNLIIDPDDFEIDVTETTKTEDGKIIEAGVKSIINLYEKGEIVTSQTNLNLKNTDLSKYNFKSKQKKQGDISCDEYFVSIEAY